MIDVINLALPYFGLIFLGYICGRVKRIPASGLAWLNFFLIYIALPCLFYRLLAKTPLEELTNPRFVAATTTATLLAFIAAYLVGFLLRKNMAEATIAGLAGAYGNVGYMGPGLALSTLGPQAAVPVALIFTFDNMLMFSLAPFLMGLAGRETRSGWATFLYVAKEIGKHPFIIATVLGVLSAAVRFQPPIALDRMMEFLQNTAAPCALFAMGVTTALRPLKRVPWEVPPIILVKLVVHPVMALLLLALLGPFSEIWIFTALLMAALPTALNVFILASQYECWIEQASSSILLGTVVSVVTLTGVMWMVKTQTLPLGLF